MPVASLLRQKLALSEDGLVAPERLAVLSAEAVALGAPLALMYATDERGAGKGFAVHAVFTVADGFLTLRIELPEAALSYPSVTRVVMAAHWYERLMHDQFGIVAEGHPDFRRLMHHENVPEHVYPLRKDFRWNEKLPTAHGTYPMHAVSGKGVYEIPVGPIHAGIIEPGHFRFNVRGERIISLEGKLFFKHKGVEKLAEGKTPEEVLTLVERISGDMVVGHSLAYVEAVERIAGTEIPARAAALRILWNELERLTAHVFDLGNMAGNGTGFTFMAAQGFRMVEDLRRLHEALTGHRYLRGALFLGGARELDSAAVTRIRETLQKTEGELRTLLDIAFENDGLMERFETTGVLREEAARAYGARGVAARASGVTSDLRISHPYAAYGVHVPKCMLESAGDVAARFRVRAREALESIRLVRAVLRDLPTGAAGAQFSAKEGSALGWNEAWRGAVIDFVQIGKDGRLDRLVVTDPSFANWPLFGEIGPGNIVPDFPLCNKSLNLSYAGTDL